MWEAFREFCRNSIALMSFFSIFAGGMVFTMFSLVFGGHDHSDVGHDLGHDVGHDGDNDSQGPGVFSVRGISLLAVGFGATAFIVQYYTNQIFVSSISGLAFGWVFAAVGMAVYRVLIRQQGSSVVKSTSYIGLVGVVTTTIPANGLGEVRLTVEGETVIRTASAESGVTIPTGTPVTVTNVSGGSVTVKR